MPIREVTPSFTFEQQRQMINLIGTDIGDASLLETPSKVLSTAINQVIRGFVTLSGQTIQLEDGTISSPSLSFDTSTNLGLYKVDNNTLGVSRALYVASGLTVDGDITFRARNGTGGTITFGDANTDNIVFTADVNSNIIPNTDNAYDLGTTTQEWRNLYIDGTAQVDTLQVDESGSVAGTLAVNGGSITTTSGSFVLLNSAATTVNAFGAATSLNIGASSGTLTLQASNILTGSPTLNLFNTNANSISAFASASGITMGYSAAAISGNTNFRIRSDDTILDGDLNVNGGEILSQQATFRLLINNTDLRVGAIGGTTTINSNLKLNGSVFDLTNQSTVVSLIDNTNPSLVFREGANDYLSFQTSNSLEKIIFHKDVNFIQPATFTSNVTTSGLTVNGNLTVNGLTTTVNSTSLTIDDPLIVLGDGQTTAAGVTTGGFTLGTTGIGIQYNNASTRFDCTEDFNLPTGKAFEINGTVVLSSTAVLGRTPGGSTAGDIVTIDAGQTLTNKILTSPDINGGTADSLTSLSVRDTSAAFDVTLASTSSVTLNAARSVTLDVVNASRTIKLAGNIDLANNFATSGNFALTLTQTAATNVTLPTTGTLATLAGSEQFTNKTYGNASSTTDADATVDSATTSYYAYVQSASGTARTINISNLTAGRVITLYLRNTNAATKQINIASSTTTTGFSAVNLSKADAGGTSQTSVTLQPTTGTAVVTVFNANGVIGGSIA